MSRKDLVWGIIVKAHEITVEKAKDTATEVGFAEGLREALAQVRSYVHNNVYDKDRERFLSAIQRIENTIVFPLELRGSMKLPIHEPTAAKVIEFFQNKVSDHVVNVARAQFLTPAVVDAKAAANLKGEEEAFLRAHGWRRSEKMPGYWLPPASHPGKDHSAHEHNHAVNSTKKWVYNGWK